MLFVLGTIGIVLFIVGVVVLVGRAYPGTGAEPSPVRRIGNRPVHW